MLRCLYGSHPSSLLKQCMALIAMPAAVCAGAAPYSGAIEAQPASAAGRGWPDAADQCGGYGAGETS